MSLYNDFLAFLKLQGKAPRPKRKADYTHRVQIVGKTDERTQLRVLCMAYENEMSAGELIDLLCHELVDDPKLLARCLIRRRSNAWTPRNKYGQYEDWSIYRRPKERTAEEVQLVNEIVDNPMVKPKAGSLEEKQREKLRELGQARRAANPNRKAA